MESGKENPYHPRKIYLDTNILVGWFKSQLDTVKSKFKIVEHLRMFGPRNTDIIKFLSDHKGIEKYISILTIAELVHVLKYNEDFKKYNLEHDTIVSLIGILGETVGFSVIKEVSIGGNTIKGVIISPEIVDFVGKHSHIIDCIHIGIAKHNELTFVSDERDLGRMKDAYSEIMTANKLIRQYE